MWHHCKDVERPQWLSTFDTNRTRFGCGRFGSHRRDGSERKTLPGHHGCATTFRAPAGTSPDVRKLVARYAHVRGAGAQIQCYFEQSSSRNGCALDLVLAEMFQSI